MIGYVGCGVMPTGQANLDIFEAVTGMEYEEGSNLTWFLAGERPFIRQATMVVQPWWWDLHDIRFGQPDTDDLQRTDGLV